MTAATIMVPLDGSPFAETALSPAARIARGSGARLRLVMAHERPLGPIPVVDTPVPTGLHLGALRSDQLDYLARISVVMEGLGKTEVDYAVADGAPGPVVVEEADRVRPDFVVMATHGRGPLSRFWIGSVADQVIRNSPAPVLLLRPRETGEGPAADVQLKRALVALDRSTEAEAILEPLARLALQHGTELTLLHVIEPILGTSGGLPQLPVALREESVEALRSEAKEYLDRVAARLRAGGLQVATKVTLGSGIALTILRQLDDGYDFVAMTTHGRSGFRRLLLGSVADKVIRGSSKPTLVLRPTH